MYVLLLQSYISTKICILLHDLVFIVYQSRLVDCLTNLFLLKTWQLYCVTVQLPLKILFLQVAYLIYLNAVKSIGRDDSQLDSGIKLKFLNFSGLLRKSNNINISVDGSGRSNVGCSCNNDTKIIGGGSGSNSCIDLSTSKRKSLCTCRAN